MGTLFKIITTILCLELIVSPVMPGLSLLSQKAYAQQDCGAGMQYDSTLNRCLTTAQAANVLNATMNCAEGDVECYRTNAQNAFQDKVNEGEAPERVADKGGFVSTVGKAATVAIPLALAMGGVKEIKAQCGASSLYAMIAGSAALFIGENLANMQHKGRLKKIKEDWGKIVNPEEANGDQDKIREKNINAQSESFEMLARSEDSLAKAAGMKKMFFTVAAAAYTASAVMAIMENFKYIQMSANPATNAAAQKIYICKEEMPKSPEAPTQTPVQPPTPEPSIGEPLETVLNEGIFNYYTKSSQVLDFISNQHLKNLKSSTHLAAFMTLQNYSNTKMSSPSIDDYQEAVLATKDIEIFKEDSSFEIFKTLSLSVISNLSLIPTANANEEKIIETSEPTVSTNSSQSSSKSSTVNTNAAKAYKEDKAKGFDFMGLAIGAGVGFAAGKFLKGKMISPLTRAALAGVLAGWTMIMRSHAASQQKASKKRAELLRKMKEEFNSASGAVYACGSADRNDPGKPTCYCYTSDNQRNSNRGNSQVCQNLWAGKSLNGTNYLSGTDTSSKICINNQNNADPTCACKQTNTCMKVGINGLSGINPGTMSILGSALAPVNGISNGSVDAANINSAALENSASRARALLDQIENSKDGKKIKAQKDKLAKGITSGLQTIAASNPPSSSLAGGGSSGFPANAGEAARMLEKELEGNTPTSISGSGDSLAAPTNSPQQDPGFEFGLTQDQFAAQQGQIAEVMKQDLDYGGNDINQGSKTNIFEVLSNRYQRSGMRRLFDEKGTTKAEPAAKSDITK